MTSYEFVEVEFWDSTKVMIYPYPISTEEGDYMMVVGPQPKTSFKAPCLHGEKPTEFLKGLLPVWAVVGKSPTRIRVTTSEVSRPVWAWPEDGTMEQWLAELVSYETRDGDNPDDKEVRTWTVHLSRPIDELDKALSPVDIFGEYRTVPSENFKDFVFAGLWDYGLRGGYSPRPGGTGISLSLDWENGSNEVIVKNVYWMNV